MIKLSKRLSAIASFIPNNSYILDIGCDHGLLDVYLYQANITTHIIASDINEFALDNAKNNILKYRLNEFIELRLGNGLDVLTSSDHVDTLIMSGIGSHTITRILRSRQDRLKNISNIIIQSNTDIPFLREELMHLKYKIQDELLVEDNNKIYTVIKFVKGRVKYRKLELYFGPVLLHENSKIFQKKNSLELTKLTSILRLLPKNDWKTRYKIKKEISLYHQI